MSSVKRTIGIAVLALALSCRAVSGAAAQLLRVRAADVPRSYYRVEAP